MGWVGWDDPEGGLAEDAALGEPGGEFIGFAASGNRICLANGAPSDSHTTADRTEK
jgi:hypothetical protein